MKVVGYVRVSSEDQAKEGVSIDVQAQKVRMLADLHNLEMVEVVADAGASAKSLDRPGLARVLAMLDAGEVAGVVVFKLDRLTRELGDWTSLIERYFGERAGRSLMSVSESVDTRTAGGRLVLNILMTVAQWERETIVERTQGAMDYKRSKGERLGHIPFGWRLHADGKCLVEDPREREARRLIVEWRRSHQTLRWIGAELVRLGFPPRSGSPTWSPSVIRHIAMSDSSDAA